MKTTISRIIKKVSQGAAMLSLATLLLSTGAVYAQQIGVLQHHESTVAVPGRLQASLFPSPDPLKLKIVFVNPAKESLTLIVRKAGKKIVYTKEINNTTSYNSKLDVSNLPDGSYTFEINGTTQSFLQTFQISTQTTRLTHVQ